jgi:shikimate 5-dehydrogenase
MGIQAIDGLSMLVSQAVLSLERWLGPLPDRASVAREMWRAASAFSGDASR